MSTYKFYPVDYKKIDAASTIPELIAVPSKSFLANFDNYDSLVLIYPSVTELLNDESLPKTIVDQLKTYKSVDGTFTAESKIAVLLPNSSAPGNRLIVSFTGSLDKNVDDVRKYAEAGSRALSRASKAGSVSPLFVVSQKVIKDKYIYSFETTVIGALSSIWQPLEGREFKPGAAKLEKIGFVTDSDKTDKTFLDFCRIVELGKFFSRDITGTEPERMSPLKMAEICVEEFKGTSVTVTVEADFKVIDKEFPLIGAVARASSHVERHQPRVIRLEYTPPGAIEETLYFVGKGLSYDTGGADLKVGGHMAGMSRDKGGAGAVAGILRMAAELKPKNTKIVGLIGAVRNSIGSDAYVTDEIITSRAGVRVRIGNTDAEGRLVLVELLAKAKEEALVSKNPVLFTVATLTGHAYRAYGSYPIAIENGVATKMKLVKEMEKIGELWGEPFEHSIVRREDYAFIAPKSAAEDVVSCNSEPSTMTARGHQFPMAFLDVTSGLDKHDLGSQNELPYIHIDIGGSAVENGDWQFGRPTGSPVLNLYKTFVK